MSIRPRPVKSFYRISLSGGQLGNMENTIGRCRIQQSSQVYIKFTLSDILRPTTPIDTQLGRRLHVNLLVCLYRYRTSLRHLRVSHIFHHNRQLQVISHSHIKLMSLHCLASSKIEGICVEPLIINGRLGHGIILIIYRYFIRSGPLRNFNIHRHFLSGTNHRIPASGGKTEMYYTSGHIVYVKFLHHLILVITDTVIQIGNCITTGK